MARYRKVEVRTWGDEKFRCLSAIPPCGQGLWLFLITGPHTGVIPGLFRAGKAGMAEELGWSAEAFDKAFAEAFTQGMVKADFQARLVWLPSAVKHNRPESPNVVKSWGSEFDLLPECDLKREAYNALKTAICGMGEAFEKAFTEAFSKPSAKPSLKAMPNQEQEQEQEQKQEKEVAADKPAAPTTPVWEAYAEVYKTRYGWPPVRNAKANGILKQLIARLGADEAPQVAAFYAAHPSAFYATRGHILDCLLADAEKLRTEWVSGKTINAQTARQNERTAANPLVEMALESRRMEAICAK